LAAGGLFSVFYIVNALHQKEAEIRQEFNLSSDQAQRYIQRTSDVMKELKYIAENRLTAENGCLPRAGEMTKRKCRTSSRCSRIPIVPQWAIPGGVAGITGLVYALLARQFFRRLRPEPRLPDWQRKPLHG
jgi:hypothetical protein